MTATTPDQTLMPSPRLALKLDGALHLAPGVSLHQVAPLVAMLFPARDRELDLHSAVLEVEPCRDERQPLLAHLPVQGVDLTAVQEQPPRPHRLLVRPVSPGLGPTLRPRPPRPPP